MSGQSPYLQMIKTFFFEMGNLSLSRLGPISILLE